MTWLNTPGGAVTLLQTANADNVGRVVFRLNTVNYAPSDLYGFVAEGTTSRIQVLGPFILTASGALNSVSADEPPAPASTQAAAPVLRATGSATIGVVLRDVLVELRDADDTLVSITSSDSTGNYLLGELGDGSYTLYVLPGYSDEPATTVYGAEQRVLAISSGASTTVNLQLVRGGVISGRVTGIGGVAVAGVPVFVRGSGSRPLATAVTTADGSYAAAGLASGVYQGRIRPFAFVGAANNSLCGCHY